MSPLDSIQSASKFVNDSEAASFKAAHPSKTDLKGAEDEVASLYYLSTLSSLAPSQDNPEKSEVAIDAENQAIEKSFLDRTKDWLWGIFSWGKNLIGWGEVEEANETKQNVEETPDSTEKESRTSTGGIPQLEHPDEKTRRRISQAVSDLNRELVQRLKDMAEFEKEMEKSTSNQKDKLIFLHLVNSSLNQKKIKETSITLAQEDVLELNKKNRELRNKYFNLIETISSNDKTLNILNWVNIGLTAIAVGGAFVGFFLGGGGSIFVFALPGSYLAKGGTTLSGGLLRFENDKNTGKLVLVKQKTKENTSHQREKVSHVQVTDEEIGKLLKTIRYHLDNQTKAASASFGR